MIKHEHGLKQQPVRCQVLHFINQTSKTELRPEQLQKIELSDVEEFGVGLELPHRSVNDGHIVELHCKFICEQNEVEFNVMTMAEAHERLANQREKIFLKWTQYDVDVWNQVLALYTGQQDDVERLFRAMKGSGN